MQSLTLMVIYVLTTATVQFIGFLISRLVDQEFPTFGLMTFLILFLGAFGIAWPIAVRIAEAIIRRPASPSRPTERPLRLTGGVVKPHRAAAQLPARNGAADGDGTG